MLQERERREIHTVTLKFSLPNSSAFSSAFAAACLTVISVSSSLMLCVIAASMFFDLVSTTCGF